MNNKTVQIAIRIPLELKDRLKALADKQYLPLAAVVKMALSAYLKEKARKR